MKMSGDCATGTITESWSFSYDGDGTRTGQVYTNIGTGSTLTTLYFMGGAYETTVETGTEKKYYSIAGQTIAMNDGTGMKYLLTDHLGSVVAIPRLPRGKLPIAEACSANRGTLRQTQGGVCRLDR
jgi:hypothetical protein